MDHAYDRWHIGSSLAIAIVVASLWPDPELNPIGPQAALADPVDNAEPKASLGQDASSADAHPKPAPAPSPYSEEIQLALKQRVDVDYDETPLEDVVSDLSNACGVRLILDIKSLESGGLSADLPVSLRLTGVTARAALSHVGRQCELVHMPAEGGILLTPPREREVRQQTLVYPVWDLVKRRGPDGAQYAVYEPLEELIKQLIHPSTWQTSLTGEGSLAHHDGMLVITQATRVHESIGELLAMLRTLPTVDEPPQDAHKAGGKFPADDQHGADQLVVRPPQPWANNLKKKLAKSIDLEVVDKPIDEWIADLAAAHELPTVLDRRALENVGIGHEPITRKLSGVTLQSALRLVLRELDLDYVLVDESVFIHRMVLADRITTLEQMQTEGVVRLFPVRDLVWADRDASPAAIEAELSKLIELIQRTIDYTNWDQVGGPGVLRRYSQRAALVSYQTPQVQEQISDLLVALRRAKAIENVGPGPASLQQAQQRIVTNVYHLIREKGAEPIEPSDLEELIGRVVEPQSWQQDDVYLKALPGRIVVRHQVRVQQMVRQLLADLRMVPIQAESPMEQAKGGGFF